MIIKSKKIIPEIEKIKRKLVKPENVFFNRKVTHLSDSTNKSINCYAYSIGSMYNGISGKHYSPGFTIGENDCYQNEKQLIAKVAEDLKNLEIDFKIKLIMNEEYLEKQFSSLKLQKEFFLLKLQQSTSLKLQENEYLIKVFYTKPNKILPFGDFHFIRQDPKSKIWFHKLGWERHPDIVQSDPGYEEEDENLKGTELSSFISHDKDANGEEYAYAYEPVCYFIIKGV